MERNEHSERAKEGDACLATSGKASCESCRDPFTGAIIRIGVMGSAAEPLAQETTQLCRELGRAVARAGCRTVTGACPGMPHQVALGAKEMEGHLIGISPGVSLKEHVEVFASPFREYDTLIFTGLGLMGRELINIRTSDIVVIVGGRSGTLGEFAIAYEEGKLIGVLTGTGGITEVMPAIEGSLGKATGAEVIYSTRPDELVTALLSRYHAPEYNCPCRPSDRECCAAAD